MRATTTIRGSVQWRASPAFLASAARRSTRYVSRELRPVRRPRPGLPRERMYSRDDVERLQRRTEERRAPDKAAARALQWGMPILESSIALIDGRQALLPRHGCRHAGAVTVAGGGRGVDLDRTTRCRCVRPHQLNSIASPRPGVPFVARAQSMLAAAAARDPFAMDLRATSVALAGSRDPSTPVAGCHQSQIRAEADGRPRPHPGVECRPPRGAG